MRWLALLLRILIGLAGAGLVWHAITTNVLYWEWVHRADAETRLQFVCGSIIADALKLLIPAYCAVYKIHLWRRPEALAVLVLAFVFSMWSGAGYVEMTRDAAAAGGSALEQRRTKLSADIRDLEGKMRALPAAGRALGRIETALAAAEAKAGRCISRAASRGEACQAVFDLKDELATEQSRTGLETALAPLMQSLAQLPPKREAEPGIATAGRLLRGLHISASDDLLAQVWSVIRLLLIELCPAAIAVFTLAPPPLPLASVELDRPKRALRTAPMRAAAGPVRAAAGKAPVAGSPICGARDRSGSAAGDLLALLQRATPGPDGWIITTQRALAESLSLSPAEVNRQLTRLARRGVVIKRAGRSGTALKLAGRIVVPLRA